MIKVEPKEIAEKVINLIKRGYKDDILLLFTEIYSDEKEVLKGLIDVQIQIKELGGGWPEIGKQITTMDEILVYSDIAINYALDNKAKLVAGKLNHNIASFCFPNMDDGVDEKLIEPGYQAAVRDLEIREELGDKVPMLWAKWLVGVSEYIKGDVDGSIATLEDTAKIALEDPVDEGLAAWSDMMRVKFQIKSGLLTQDDAAKDIKKIEKALTKQDDKWGLGTLKQIKEL
jgi:hypothetical protein